MVDFRRGEGEEVFTPPGGPPQAAPPRDIYSKMGEEAIFRMMRDFYVRLGESSIRGMFPEDLEAAADKSAAFFVFLLGGPPLYQRRHGSPMMRRRHLPFRINENARQVWLGCFDKVLEEAPKKYGFPEERIEAFKAFLRDFSAWMVNVR